MLRQDNQTFHYYGSAITFKKGDSVMVNATEMAKPFGKRPTDYLRLPATKELITAVVRKSHIEESNLIITEKGGINRGSTWLHEDLALDFAQWLSIDFRLWCNDRIKEILTQGVATISNDDEVIARAMSVLQKRLDESKQKVKTLEAQTELQSEQLRLQAPKVEYTDNVLNSVNTYTSTQVAKDLNLRTAEQLHNILRDWGVMIRQSGQWMLSAKHCEHEYTKTRTHLFTRQDGTQGTSNITVWTEKGRLFLHQLFSQKGGMQ